MKNEERIETLGRRVSRLTIVGVLLALMAEATAFQSKTSYIAVPLLIGSLCLLFVSLYCAVLLKKEKRKVKP